MGYSKVSAFGGKRANVHSKIMWALTRSLFPVIRSRGLDVIARSIRDACGVTDCYSQVRLNEDTVFAFPVYDSYWGCHVHGNIAYEPALSLLFEKIAGYKFSFIDCGANFGYWSALLTSQAFGAHECIAIESSPETYRGLLQNAELNANRFRCLNRAIWDKSGEKVSFMEGGRHAGRHIAGFEVRSHPANVRRMFTPAEHSVEVETVSIDEIVDSLEVKSLVIKLDVEGSELRAIDGASTSSARDAIFIYEDHGADVTHRVTKGMLARGFRIYFPELGGHIQRILELRQLSKIKRNRRCGYNFVAARGFGILIDAATEVG